MEAVDPEFQPALDIPNGGVLLALPALLANGLLSHTDRLFALPKGFYSLYSIFICITFMLLARLKSVEALRYCAPGEWGKLLGLDRIPEAKIMREKIGHLAKNGKVKEWCSELCQDWMKERPEEAACLYVDGHVRVYHGHKGNLPKHYVARQKLCLHATCDYWVNAMDGNPFFLLTKDIDPGLLQVLEQEIVPKLEQEIPNQPSQEQLNQDPSLHRFVLIFDREGYSPDFIRKMKKKRIGCLTYNKFPTENWPDDEFVCRNVTLGSGEEVEMKLAERGVFLRNKVWVTEIRRQMRNGHQTAILSTVHRLSVEAQAACMFARWSQENFFKYMRRNFGLDQLAEYGVDEIPKDTKVVNPKYRSVDGEIRSKRGMLSGKLAEFGSITIDGELDEKKVLKYQEKKSKLQDTINCLERELEK
ncbi:MAG: hypothetical protein KDK64_08580, partial [Chlamydiia bacterium]|nr:hypothetical protein [Chlamydiia bacterium]